jgi:hypothetical protein
MTTFNEQDDLGRKALDARLVAELRAAYVRLAESAVRMAMLVARYEDQNRGQR